MLVACHAIGSTGGHCDNSPFPPERVKPSGPIEGVCNGPEQCRAAVRYQMKRSEEHTSELQSLMRISYAVFCLKKKINKNIVKYRLPNISIIYRLVSNISIYTRIMI